MLDSFITVALSVSNSVTADLTPFNPRPFVSEQTHLRMTCNAQFVLWGLETAQLNFEYRGRNVLPAHREVHTVFMEEFSLVEVGPKMFWCLS